MKHLDPQLFQGGSLGLRRRFERGSVAFARLLQVFCSMSKVRAGLGLV